MKELKNVQNITVIGDGGWGTTLAIHLAKNGHDVCLWGAFETYVAKVTKTRVNSKFLPGIKLPKNIQLTASLKDALNFSNVIVLVTPSQFLESTLKKIKKLSYKNKVFVSAVKGVEPKNFMTMSQIINKELGGIKLAVLSGPTIAKEVALGIPSTAVVASKNINLARSIQTIFHSTNFRIYANNDVVGVELGGSIKNIIAIACGICDGMKFGTNAKAAILTRGLAEMARLGKALKAKPSTFSGLSGLGDLATTCFSPNSRNRFVGSELGKGKPIKQILSKMDMVAEGVLSTKAVYLLSKKLKISMPITEAVYKIIYKNQSPDRIVSMLMQRDLKKED